MSKRTSLNSFTRIFMLVMLVLSMSLVIVNAQDATPAPSVLGTGSITISMWDGLTGSDGATMLAMEAAFVAENPEYTIVDEQIDWGILYPKLQAAFVANTPPDVFIVHVAEIPQYQSLGVLQSNDDLFDYAGGPLPAADFAEPAFSNTLVDGERYGVLLDNHGFGTYINRDLVAAAGFDPDVPPATGEEVLALLQALTLDANGNNAASPDFDPENIVQWGTALDWYHYTFQSILFQFGGTVISEDGTTATINSEAGVQALQTLVDLVYKYHVMPPPAGFSSWDSFAAGQVGILGTGTWFVNRIRQNPEISWTTWPMYQLGPEPGAMFGAHVFLIPANTTGEKLDAVKKMMVWMSDNNGIWATSGQVPARISIRDGLDPELFPSNITIGQSFEVGGQMEVPSPVGLDIVTAEDPEIDAAMNGLKTPQQALDDAAARIQEILDRANS